MFSWSKLLQNKFWIKLSLDGCLCLSIWFLGENSWGFAKQENHFYYILYVIAWFVIILKAIVEIYLWKCENKYVDIENERDEYKGYYDVLKSNIQNVLDSHLRTTSQRLGFHQQKHKIDRITLFVLRDQKDVFIVSRYSENNKLKNIKREKEYNKDKGVIEKALNHDWHFINNLPDPKEKRKIYRQMQNSHYNLNSTDVSSLSMFSRLYGAKRIDIELDISNGVDVLGVLVVESENNLRFSEEDLKLELEILSKKVSPLIQMIDKVVEGKSLEFNTEVEKQN